VENFALQLDSPSIWDTSGRFTSINGTVQPTITVSAGEIQRWRFVHAGIHDTINVQIVRASPMGAANLIAASSLSGNRQQQKADLAVSCAATPDTLIPQFEIASDGLTRAKIHTIRAAKIGDVLESNYLQPGYRSDILVAFPAAGDYCLLDQAAPAPERVSNGPGGQGPSTPQLLAYIHVRGGQTVTTDLQDYIETSLYDANPQLPSTVRSALRGGDLSPWAPFKDLSPATKPDVQHANFVIHFPAFQINGTSYDPNIVNITRQVNTSDDWILTSEGEPHIFHIHINPFEVIDVTKNDATGQQTSIFNQDGTCRADSVVSDKQGLADQYCGMHHVFRDTVIVENNYQVHIRTRYDRYIGEYVLHCHILDHEDSGMMLNIAIVPDLKAPGGGLGMPFMRRTMLGTEPPSPKRSDLNYGFWPICRGGAANRNRSLAN
jgi:FtsP/CotA-like multicopper oxidase with cupredoxin domain